MHVIRNTTAALALSLFAGSGYGAGSEPSDPLYVYYWNSLVCQNQKTKAVCHLWLNPDRTFVLSYDLGIQAKPLEIEGPYRIEFWEGTYRVRAGEVCLTPERSPPGKTFVSRERGELFAASGCYAIGTRRIGESWMQADRSGNPVKVWLLSNR